VNCREMRLAARLWEGRLDLVSAIGVNATGDAGDTSPAIFGQPGMK